MVHLAPVLVLVHNAACKYVHKQMDYFIGCDSSIAFDGQELISPSYANKNKRMGLHKWLIRARCCANPINANSSRRSLFSELFLDAVLFRGCSAVLHSVLRAEMLRRKHT